MNRTIFLINSALLVFLLAANLHEDETQQTMSVDSNLTGPFKLGGLQAAQPKIAPGIQVNSLPHPFNLNGRMPYQVWVNGERLKLNGDKANQIVE